MRSTVVAKLEAEEEVLYMALDDPKYFDGLEWHPSDGVVRELSDKEVKTPIPNPDTYLNPSPNSNPHPHPNQFPPLNPIPNNGTPCEEPSVVVCCCSQVQTAMYTARHFISSERSMTPPVKIPRLVSAGRVGLKEGAQISVIWDGVPNTATLVVDHGRSSLL